MMDYSGLDDDSDEQNEGGRALELKFSIGFSCFYIILKGKFSILPILVSSP